MSRFDWLSELIARCEEEHILFHGGSARELAPAHVLHIDIEDWGKFAVMAAEQQTRWCAVWAVQQDEETLLMNACFEKQGDYLVIRAPLDIHSPVLPSQAPVFPAANRPERHSQDMFGVMFGNHPDSRRWIRHQAWDEEIFPLRKDIRMAHSDQVAPADTYYPFFQAQGSGVYEIPVGPVHAGIIEPGHFRFQAVGETILNLEERLGYVHKGIEKIAEGRDAEGLAKLAGRISGDTTVAHTWCACMAMERAANVAVPRRGIYLRALLAERERVANHLGDIGAICNDVGFAFANSQFSRLREIWQRTQSVIFKHRLLMDTIVPGGVKVDLSSQQCETLSQQHAVIKTELNELMAILNDHASLEDRLVSAGHLSHELATKLGVVGYLAKASGVDYDLRRDHAYAPYDRMNIDSPCYQQGDVATRLQVRADEIIHSLILMDTLLQQLPDGDIANTWKPPVAICEGLGMVEAWRGEIISYVQFDATGKISRFYARDPSWLNWPALEQLIDGNIVPDFPVCNKSVNGSYSGHDL